MTNRLKDAEDRLMDLQGELDAVLEESDGFAWLEEFHAEAEAIDRAMLLEERIQDAAHEAFVLSSELQMDAA